MNNEIGSVFKIRVKQGEEEVEVLGKNFGTVDAKFKELEKKYLAES
jgi:hypothetical protein